MSLAFSGWRPGILLFLAVYSTMHRTAPNHTDSMIWPKMSIALLLRDSDDCFFPFSKWVLTPQGLEPYFCDGLEGERSPRTCHRLRVHLEEGWVSLDPQNSRYFHRSQLPPRAWLSPRARMCHMLVLPARGASRAAPSPVQAARASNTSLCDVGSRRVVVGASQALLGVVRTYLWCHLSCSDK